MKLLHALRIQWDRGLALALGLTGVVALVVAWIAVNDTIFAFRQTPYLISGGLGGTVLLCGAYTLWLSADLRDTWRKLDRLEDQLNNYAGAADASTTFADDANGPNDLTVLDAQFEQANR